MKKKNVMVVESGYFLGDIVNRLLEEQEALNIIRVTPDSVEQLNLALSKYQPEVILIDDTIHNENYYKLVVFLIDIPDTRVVVVHANTNKVDVFVRQEVEFQDAPEFYRILSV